MYSVSRVASGPRAKLALKVLLLPEVYSTDRSKAVVPMLVLPFATLSFILRGDCFKYCHELFCYCVFSIFSIAITSLRKKRANLSAFRVSSSSWCLGRAATCNCGALWTFSLPCFHSKIPEWAKNYISEINK